MTAYPSPANWQKAWLAGDSIPQRFFRNQPFDWAAGVREVGAWTPLDDAAVEEWKALLIPHVADAGSLAPIDQLRCPDALVVVSGQQAGAGLGPLYSLFKALAAGRWAREVAAQTGRPTVALFWVASDDHDLEEVRRAAWLGGDGGLRESDLAADSADGSRSVWREKLDSAKVAAFLEEFEAGTPPTEFRPTVLELLRQAFIPGATFESQFVRLACRLLLPLGIVPIVPRLRFLRERAADLLALEIDHSAKTNANVMAQADALRAVGVEPLLHRRGNELNFFVDIDEIRAPISRREDGLLVARSPIDKGVELASWSEGELLTLLRSEPGRFSPNAILRPLVQDSALPTVAYVGGPGEILYHAQLAPLYAQFGVHRAALLPRPNLFLLDTKSTKALQKLGLSPESLSTGSDPTASLATASSPLLDKHDGQAAAVEAALAELKKFLAEEIPDQAVERSFEKLAGAATTGLERLRERVAASIASRDEERTRSAAKLRDVLFPKGTPQERILTPLAPLLVNYGPGIVARLYEEMPLRETEFVALSLAAISQPAEARVS
ncbi:bacillithiol biosynthesis cysteine-adding enzyme BshC [bacterium]|nr:bacillithiol biosynthesis cysteine-adding enzyme BshC [bacterium]